MTEQQADRLLRELRNLKGVCFLAAAVTAVFVGLWITAQVSQRNPTAILDRELTLMRRELEYVRVGLFPLIDGKVVFPADGTKGVGAL